MQIKMLESTNCDGKLAKVNEVVNASDKDGRYLVATGQAEVFSGEAEEKPSRKRTVKKSPANKAVTTDELETR